MIMQTGLSYILLWRVLAIFLLIGALLGALLGLLLIFKSPLIQCVNRVANRWISMRRFERLLDRSISLERWFHKHHKPTGMAIVLGALYMLVYFGFEFDKAYVLQRLSSAVPAALLGGLLDALVLISLTGAAVALCVGLIFWLRPSLLRGIEAGANRWISLRHATEVLDVPHNQVEYFAQRYSREVGWLLLLGSVFLFFLMFRLLA
jgi:hypothetical protein